MRGRAIVLVAALRLRILPRSVDVDPPWPAMRGIYRLLSATGGASVVFGRLVTPTAASYLPALRAAPEATLRSPYAGTLLGIGTRARSPRPQLGLRFPSALRLLVGGGSASGWPSAWITHP